MNRVWIFFVLLIIACSSVPSPTFPLKEPPRDALERAEEHMNEFIVEFYAPPNYEAIPNSVELVGSQVLEIDERDQNNGVLEQWCIAFTYQVDLGEDTGTANFYRIYQVNRKSSGWFLVVMRNFSDETNYWLYVAETWERCLVY